MIELTAHAEGIVVSVRAQPGAKQDSILGERAGALRVAVSAAPERGKANEAIRETLAEALDWKASRIRLLSGATSRQKRFLFVGLDRGELERRIGALAAE
jgi:hypothetical protein